MRILPKLQLQRSEVWLPVPAHNIRGHRLLQWGLVHPAADGPQRAGDVARHPAEGSGAGGRLQRQRYDGGALTGLTDRQAGCQGGLWEGHTRRHTDRWHSPVSQGKPGGRRGDGRARHYESQMDRLWQVVKLKGNSIHILIDSQTLVAHRTLVVCILFHHTVICLIGRKWRTQHSFCGWITLEEFILCP